MEKVASLRAYHGGVGRWIPPELHVSKLPSFPCDQYQVSPLRQLWGSHDFDYAVLATSFFAPQARRCGMCHDVATNRLHRWTRKHAGTVQVGCNNLICDDDSHSKFVCQALQTTQKLTQLDLTSSQLSPAAISVAVMVMAEYGR